MAGDPPSGHTDEFRGISRDPSALRRRRGPDECGRPTRELASTSAANDDFFYGRVLDGFMRPSNRIMHVHFAGADLGLGGAGGSLQPQASLEPAHPLEQFCAVCVLSNHVLVSRTGTPGFPRNLTPGRDRAVARVSG